MMTERAAQAGQLALAQDIMTRNLRRMAFAVPAGAILLGAIGAVVDLRFMLFSVAFILGWTQLVGL
jgi:hypothetical protein